MADDEKEVLDIMARRIESAGYAVIKAYDGQEAWEKIIQDSPDIILLDLTMPGRDGYEILQELRQNPPSNKWQPVIIVSARHELEDIKKGFTLEADHYLTKPCNIDDILKAIRLMVSLIPQRKSEKEMLGEDGHQGSG